MQKLSSCLILASSAAAQESWSKDAVPHAHGGYAGHATQSYGVSSYGAAPYSAHAGHAGHGVSHAHAGHGSSHAGHGYSTGYAYEPKYGSDGYKIRARSDPHNASYKTVYAKCTLEDPEEESYVGGIIQFMQAPGSKTQIIGEVWGVSPGAHGFHVHELGDLRGGCGGLGGHYNPDGSDHGAAHDHAGHRHAGDLGQAIANEYGQAKISQSEALIDLWGNHSIIGRSIVIHEKKDDLGRGGNKGSLASGNAGARIGCCTIGLAAGPKPKYEAKPASYGYSAPSYGYSASTPSYGYSAPKW